MGQLSPHILSALLVSLQRLQRTIELDPSDPAPRRLKSSILRTIADLDRLKSPRSPRRVLIQIQPPPNSGR